MRYQYEQGMYCLKSEEHTPEIGVARHSVEGERFAVVGLLYRESPLGTFLVAHGNVRWIKGQYDRLMAHCEREGLDNQAGEIRLAYSSKMPVHELNNCMTISGYLGRYLATHPEVVTVRPPDRHQDRKQNNESQQLMAG